MAYTLAHRSTHHRFVGDLPMMEVHDAVNEKPTCRLDRLIADGVAVVFEPDAIGQAHDRGFDNCPNCLGRESDILIHPRTDG